MTLDTIKLKFEAFKNIFRKPIHNQIIKNKVMVIDNLDIKNCKLIKCTIIYGGEKVQINDNELIDCNYQFFGEAANTLILMKGLDEAGAKVLLQRTFPNTFRRSTYEN